MQTLPPTFQPNVLVLCTNVRLAHYLRPSCSPLTGYVRDFCNKDLFCKNSSFLLQHFIQIMTMTQKSHASGRRNYHQQCSLPSFTSSFKAVSYKLCSVFPGVFHSLKYCFGIHVTGSVFTPLIQTQHTRECCSCRATTVGDRVISTVYTAFHCQEEADENTESRFQRCFFR